MLDLHAQIEMELWALAGVSIAVHGVPGILLGIRGYPFQTSLLK